MAIQAMAAGLFICITFRSWIEEAYSQLGPRKLSLGRHAKVAICNRWHGNELRSKAIGQSFRVRDIPNRSGADQLAPIARRRPSYHHELYLHQQNGTVLEHCFAVNPQLSNTQPLPVDGRSRHRALCKTIEVLYERTVVVEDIIISMGREDLLNRALGGRICALKKIREIQAMDCQDQMPPRLLKCIAPQCKHGNQEYQSAEHLAKHIRNTRDRSHQFHRAILTGTYCFQCGKEFLTGTSSLAKHEKDYHRESGKSRLETSRAFRTAFTHDGSLLQPNKNHVAAQSEESEAGCEEESPGASAADSCSDGSGQREEVMKMFEQINTRVERLEKENVRLREIGDRIRPLGERKRRRGDDGSFTDLAESRSAIWSKCPNGSAPSVLAHDLSNGAPTVPYSDQVSSSDSAGSNRHLNPSPEGPTISDESPSQLGSMYPGQLQPFHTSRLLDFSNPHPDPSQLQPFPISPLLDFSNPRPDPSQLRPFPTSPLYDFSNPRHNPTPLPPTGSNEYPAQILLFDPTEDYVQS
ncbi:hypothetical protein I7I51_06860 [Histoplasma capsulatum]|uniref:Uncharacterized protein n=1 Tax=Ajellomyces capsulatus TaxID=5037 RepID=A0A8A1MJC5_AJECA|nr:hypothetical protein I7I51_06860 [Histoplasma capsulatum]